MFDPFDDGCVRLRCRGCNKKLKTRAKAQGQIFRCPYCDTINTMPLGEGQQAKMVQSDPTVAVGDIKVAEEGKKKRWAPTVRAEERVPEVDRVFDVIDRENERVRRQLHNILLHPDKTDAEKIEMLKGLKLEVTRNVKSIVHIIRSEFSIRLEGLQNHPMNKSVQIQNEIKKLQGQIARFDMFCTNFFNFKLDNNSKSAKSS